MHNIREDDPYYIISHYKLRNIKSVRFAILELKNGINISKDAANSVVFIVEFHSTIVTLGRTNKFALLSLNLMVRLLVLQVADSRWPWLMK